MLQKKVCMLGSFSVGKSSLVRRFVESMFDEQYHTTIGVKVDKKVVNANGEDLTLVLWDIYGEDVFQKMRMSYLRGMHGYILVVDGTRRQTLDDALALNDRVVAGIRKSSRCAGLNKFDLTDQWEIDSAQETQLTAAGWTLEQHQRENGRRCRKSVSAAGASDAGQINALRHSIFESFLAGQGYALFEYLGDGEFRLIGNGRTGAPIFGARSPAATNRSASADKSPFLENFLVDAEEFWRAQSPGSANSGNWIERGADGVEIPLEASARSLDGKRILLIRNLSETFGQQQKMVSDRAQFPARTRKTPERNSEERNSAALHRARSHPTAQRHERRVSSARAGKSSRRSCANT